VSEWVQLHERPVAWLSLDENDNDLTRFLTYLIAALQEIEENIGIDVQEALNTSQSPRAETLVTLLINEIDAYKSQIILVLDDCHLITNPSIFDIVDFLLDHLPPTMNMILIGRVDPPISLSRLRGQGEMTEIRTNDLRFTENEINIFLNDLMKLDLEHEDISTLDSRTEGWIAGLQLAALSLRGREDKKEFVAAFSGSHHYIIDYLVDEVKSRQPEEIQKFLCQTSILERLSAPLCDAVLEISTSHQILRKLEEANLFLIPLDDERRWYRYHHLFDEFLKQCLRENQSTVIPDLHQRASGWYERNGIMDEAVRHALIGEDFENAAHLVEQNGMLMLERSELAALMKWVDALPEDQVRIHPRLCVFHAWTLRLSGSPYEIVESRIQDAELALENAGWHPTQMKPIEKSLLPVKEAHNLWAHIFAIRAFQAVYREDIDRVFKMAEKAYTYSPDEKFVKSSLRFALGWAHRLSGDLEAAYQSFAESSALSQAAGNFYMAVSTRCRAAFGLVLAGKLLQAEQDFQDALRLAASKDGRQYPVAGYAYVYLGGIHYEWNDLETAKEYSFAGIQLCERVGFIMDQAVGYVNLARLDIAERDLDGAQEACQSAWELSQLMKDYVYVRRWVEDCRVRLWTAQGNYDALRSWVQTSDLKIEDDPNFRRDIDHIILARALVTLGKEQPMGTHLENALGLLDRLLEMSEKAGWRGKGIEILVLQSLALQAAGQDEAALRSLERALSLAEPEGYVRTFIDEGEPMAMLLRQTDVNKDYVNELLAAFEPSRTKVQKVVTQPLVEPLTEREWEVLCLLGTELSGPEISRELLVSLNTMRTHTKNIYSKLAVSNRRAAIHRAEELNLI